MPLISLANILHNARLWNDAVIVATMAVEIAPHFAVNHFTLGNVYVAMVSVEGRVAALAVPPVLGLAVLSPGPGCPPVLGLAVPPSWAWLSPRSWAWLSPWSWAWLSPWRTSVFRCLVTLSTASRFLCVLCLSIISATKGHFMAEGFVK